MITLKTDGVKITGWKRVIGERHIDLISERIEMHSAMFRNVPEIKVGAVCRLFDDTKLISTFRADRVQRTLSDRGKTISIWGRGITSDLVDCNYLSTWEWINYRAQKIVEDLVAPFDIETVFSEADMSLISYRANYGDTIANVIGDIVKRYPVRMLTDEQGRLVFEPEGNIFSDTNYEQGKNLHFCSLIEDEYNTYSEYICHSQQQGADTTAPETICEIASTVSDTQINRYRPFLILPSGNINRNAASTIAGNEKKVRRAKAKKLIIYQPYWAEPFLNRRVFIVSKELGIKGYYFVASTKFTLEAGERKNSVTLQEIPES